MRATAFLRSANLLNCLLPEMLFQISTNRPSGQSADTFPSAALESNWIAVRSPACAASAALANTVMLSSLSIVNVAMCAFSFARELSRRCHIDHSVAHTKPVYSDACPAPGKAFEEDEAVLCSNYA